MCMIIILLSSLVLRLLLSLPSHLLSLVLLLFHLAVLSITSRALLTLRVQILLSALDTFLYDVAERQLDLCGLELHARVLPQQDSARDKQGVPQVPGGRGREAIEGDSEQEVEEEGRCREV